MELAAGRTDSGFFVTIAHRSGVKSHASATKSNRLVARELRLLGGYEEEDHWGTLTTAAGAVRVPSEQGAYHAYYEQFALAVAGKGPEPVSGSEAVHTLEVLDAARLSDSESRSVDLED